MTDDTMQAFLRRRVSDPNIAVKHHDLQWSWSQHLAQATARAAALIGAADPQRPLHVGALLGNTPEMLNQMAGAGLGGYVLCGLNNTRRGDALAADVRRADCQFVVTDAEHRPLLDGLDVEGTQIFDTSTPQWAEFVCAAGELVPHREVSATDAFMMIFTSGTSGNPKAVQVSHLMAMFAGTNLVQRFVLSEQDTCYVSMPLFHSNAVVAGWAPAVVSGAAIVPAKFSATKFLDDVRRYGATYMNYVGKPLAYILATPERGDDADNPLRVAFGNEANDKDIEEFGRRFGVQVEDGFGSTENAVIVIREEGTPKGSIGRGIDGIAIYNSDTITECAEARFDATGALANADEAVGELVNTAGSGFFTGYYNDPAANAERMRHGMYWSGDLAYRDADGWIYLAGRTADWMRVDGENMAAAPIERILLRHSVINRVAVYAVPDGQVGDQVMAAVVLNEGKTLDPDEFEAFLATQPDLSPKARPRYLRIATDLPSTATHKVLKRQLIAQATAIGEDETLWVREPRGTAYRNAASSPDNPAGPPSR
ncbi:fatty-acid--CoA ligase FadD1 [Mycobacterium montefiorense]|uniref:Acyl-CoA synthetase n=1 Tax=Mycobacterium montefiorense TaxID=154654 RepID=A0AA37PQ18_9MYCO|nr:fatty-acid--CoA ligase FadD1 [Mycobacterium montefiorense]GBG37737.1 acyl-CoA synthetase [Mycobacterium montefiorense]GKU34875.1 acyl-CoA synthetase [Mycobacterium montefiorense]GKU40888.1 acyl-CoA synthetase [Mycobacterium montefiorense]GKU46997.1 acyl-CoA synthetase [Mycobacterium montefiorense]GKU49117.1 acyl-CoA synthetase [Mycobacterium montefiorense]